MSMKVVPPLALPPGGAFSRASTKTYWDSTGTLRTAAVDQPCFTFDPSNLKKAPIASIEVERWNYIRNNTMQGVVAGTPGTVPTYWTVEASGTNGLVREVQPAGVQNGVEYFDLRYYGTATVGGTHNINFEQGTAIGTAPGEAWGASVYVGLAAGDASTVTTRLQVSERDNSGVQLFADSQDFYLTAGGALSRIGMEHTVQTSGAAKITHKIIFSYVTGAAVDVTFRIGLPQLERDTVSSVIKTINGAVMRAADVVTGTGLIHSTAPEVAPAAYASGTTYGLDQTVSVNGAAGLRSVYRSLQASNLGHAPASSPTWWEYLGDTYQSYGAGTYALGDRVIDPFSHIVYESLIGSNTGTLSEEAKWKAIGPTNKTAMVDLLRDTATLAPKVVGAIFKPGQRVDALGLVGMTATSASIVVYVDGQMKYHVVEDLNTRTVNDWYDYFFAPFSTKEAIAKFDLPPYSDAVISVALICTGGTPACGGCVMGMSVDMGEVQYEAESDTLNFSIVERNTQDGSAVMTASRNVPKTVSNIELPKSRVNAIRALRDSLNGKPALWAGLDDDASGYFEALLIVGFYRRFTINLRYPEYAIISLELEEI